MKICIIIPAYNESQNIGLLVQSLRQKALDVLVIDDGSTDGTDRIARELGAQVIRHAQREGKGCSLREGFRHVLRQDYDGVITMDGDGQHDAADIDKFIEEAQRGRAGIITGNRMTDSRSMPFLRYCTNRFMSWLISLACGQKIADTQCGYRYISCDILRQVNYVSRDFEIESEILLKSCKRGFQVRSVPVKTIYRNEKSHINPAVDTVRFFVYFIREMCSAKK